MRQGPTLNLEPVDSARLVGQWALGVLMSLSSALGWQVHRTPFSYFIGTLGSNLGLYASTDWLSYCLSPCICFDWTWKYIMFTFSPLNIKLEVLEITTMITAKCSFIASLSVFEEAMRRTEAFGWTLSTLKLIQQISLCSRLWTRSLTAQRMSHVMVLSPTTYLFGLRIK